MLDRLEMSEWNGNLIVTINVLSRRPNLVMCGIAGFVNYDQRDNVKEIIHAMNDAMRHRGPDGEGIYMDRLAVLGHRRLSIIDLTGGAQPMSNEDSTLHLVCNGEIYNHLELRDRLERSGHRFRTHSDSEVIIHLYEDYGSKTAEMLCGMFAFALWDSRKQLLVMSRDRVGQKPLVYTLRNRSLVFASEINALRRHPSFSNELNADAIGDFLALQYIPFPNCIYADVKKLPPAHTLLFDSNTGKLEIFQYWNINYTRKMTISLPDASRQLRDLLVKSVHRRLMSDVEIGCFLSGGIDSAIITALVAKMRQPDRTPAFTVGFSDRLYDERYGSRLTAQHINSLTDNSLEYVETVVDASNFELVKKIVSRCGEPFADASILPTSLLSAFAKQKVSVVLSGDGADEIFAGYERYLAIHFASCINRLPATLRRALFNLPQKFLPDSGERTFTGRLRRFLNMLAAPNQQQYLSLLNRCPPALWNKIAGERLLHHTPSESGLQSSYTAAVDAAERCMELDFHTYLPNDILMKVDIASMSESLEVRNPYLDHEVVEFAIQLPLAFKLNGLESKYLLKHTFAELIPSNAGRIRKRGFGIPVASWLRDAWRKPAETTLVESQLINSGWINQEGLHSLWQEHQQGKRDHSYLLWNLLILAIFMQRMNAA